MNKKKSLKIENMDPAVLKSNPWNTNVVSPDNQRKLEASLDRFGLFKPILVRQLDDGSLEVLGGEHRLQAAVAKGFDTVPVLNLGTLSDNEAKEISLVDNGRYGTDDTLQLAELLESMDLDSADLASFMPFADGDIERIFAAVNIDVEDLEMDDEPPVKPAAKPVQEFTIMRFKVPVDDQGKVQDRINTVMREQGFTKDDSLTNAGMALVHICQGK